MSVTEWYEKQDILLVGVTSNLGRILLEKLLRSFPDCKIYAILRSRNGLNKDDRLKSIFSSPGFERLRQQEPDAITRVKGLEGNLLYENFGLSKEDSSSLRNVQVLFHAAGPHDEVYEFSKQLPSLRALVVATSLFNKGISIPETPSSLKIPTTILRIPLLGPVYKDPIPGYVDVLKGSTALVVGAGYALGKSEFSAQILPVDFAANSLILAAYERSLGIAETNESIVYDLPNLGCTWGELVKKGNLANRKFSYPTFGIRGMTSLAYLHWMVVLFLEWLPSAVCDGILSLFGAKPRCVEEYEKVHQALRSLEPITSRSWTIDTNPIFKLQERLTLQDREKFPIFGDIDVESYTLCAAASARKYCVNETNITIVNSFKRLFIGLAVALVVYLIFK